MPRLDARARAQASPVSRLTVLRPARANDDERRERAMKVPEAWSAALSGETEKPYFSELGRFVAAERERTTVYPADADVFRALELVPPAAVKLVILGQDPYHDEGQAHGLCFSVMPPTKPPPSLKNVFKELASDLGVVVPPGVGDLTPWARQGALLLNTVLTVVAHSPASHQKRGWEAFTDAVIDVVARGDRKVVFCLWGAHARAKAKNIDRARHVVVEGAHPSPLSAKKFLGSKPFSAIDDGLRALGHTAMDWRLG